MNLGTNTEPFYELAGTGESIGQRQRTNMGSSGAFRVGEIGIPPTTSPSSRSFHSKANDESIVVENPWPLPPPDESMDTLTARADASGDDEPELPWPPEPEDVSSAAEPDQRVHNGSESPWPPAAPEVSDSEGSMGGREPSYLKVIPGETEFKPN